MKTNDVRKKDAPELRKLIQELSGELREFRFGMSGAALKNVRRARTIRREIARIKTVLAEKK